MEIILSQEVANLGFKDDVVIVKNGYGRNFLIPKGLGILATDSAKKVLAENLKQRAFKEQKIVDDATKTATDLKGLEVKLSAKVADGGHKLFGSITTIDIAANFAKAGQEIEKKYITITGGSVKPNARVIVIDKDLKERKAKILQVLGHHGLERVEIEEAKAGDIICITGVEALNISDTLCDPEHINPMPPLTVDEPTVSMVFQVNDSPFCGQEGKYVTSRNIKDRLEQELLHNVALRVEDGESADKFKVSGRGELHLSVLIETMRRENYEVAVSKPQVIQREVDGVIHEPFEIVVIDIEEQHQGAIMEEMGNRKADLQSITVTENGRMKLDFMAPSRGMIGFRSSFLTLTSGSGILTSIFDHYGPAKKGEIAKRQNGVMYSMTAGKTLAYGLFNLQNRGRMFVGHGLDVYKGQIVGLHARDNDLPVNPTKAKQLNNIRAAGTDENLILTPHIVHTLEQALEFIEDDELVEVTPQSIRLRKKVIR